MIASVIVAVDVTHVSKTEPFIVEWNGIANVAVSLISYVMQQPLEGVSFSTIQNSGTVKITDHKKLWEQLLPHLSEKDPIAARVIKWLECEISETICLSVLGHVIHISYDEFVALIFNPDANVPALKPFKSVIDCLFPIAFPYTAGIHYV